jgi:hypothetical protein
MADDLEIPDGGKIDNKLLLSTLRDIRRDQRETKDLLLALTKHVSELEKRLARRVDDVKDDLEIIIKSELMARLTNFETPIDQKIDELLAQ